MRERPILFQGPMVRALLAGTKTQTRREVKWRGLAPGLNLQFSGLSVERSGSNFVLTSPTRNSHEYRSVPQPCPYGQPGDRLWVREKARCNYRGETPPENRGTIGVEYAAGGSRMQPYVLDCRDDFPWFPGRSHDVDGTMRWAPGIHMPRWASRITLEITGVRVERLQAIGDRDAQAEGIAQHADGHGWHVEDGRHYMASPVDSYASLWETINGPGSWDANPWVWCISFRRTA